MEKLVPIQPNSMAMIISGNLAGHPVLCLYPHPDREGMWICGSEKYAMKATIPASRLMMLEGFRDSRLHDRLVIKHYSSKK